MWVAFATHIFSAKNFRKLYIESVKTVNKMTLNELVKLTTLWTTGPCLIYTTGCIVFSPSDAMLTCVHPTYFFFFYLILIWFGVLQQSQHCWLINQYFVHIFLPTTDNCPSWISWRRMTIEIIPWLISTSYVAELRFELDLQTCTLFRGAHPPCLSKIKTHW